MKNQPTALLVEDDGAIREALTEFLETAGYRVTAFATAEQGIASLRAQSFSLLVTDYVLPGESGGWLVRQGRAEGLLQTTLVIMVTALLKPPEFADVRVLRKPLDIGQLLDEVGLPRVQARSALG